jgi:hypothetical protein
MGAYVHVARVHRRPDLRRVVGLNGAQILKARTGDE